MDKKTVIFILSLRNSGSTVMSGLLSRYAGAVSLSELDKNLNARKTIDPYNDKDRPCTCGVTMHECEVWGEFMRTNPDKNAPYTEQYKHLLSCSALEQYSVLIDASKGEERLRQLLELEAEGVVNVHVVFLLKDVREWIASRRKLGFRSRIHSAIMWHRANKRQQKLLRERNVSHTQVGYMELCQQPEAVSRRVYADAGLSPDRFDLMTEPVTHIAYGNPVKLDLGKLHTIRYDAKWLVDYWTNLTMLCLPTIFKWNCDNVHTQYK